MKTRVDKDKDKLKQQSTFVVSEPRLTPRESVSVTTQSLFKPVEVRKDYIDQQFSNAIYELEVSIQNAMSGSKK